MILLVDRVVVYRPAMFHCVPVSSAAAEQSLTAGVQRPLTRQQVHRPPCTTSSSITRALHCTYSPSSSAGHTTRPSRRASPPPHRHGVTSSNVRARPRTTAAGLALNHGDLYGTIGADFRFEVPGQSSVGLICGGRGQWLGAPWRVRSTSL